MRRVPLAADIDAAIIAHDRGLLRCGLANLVSEAALFYAARGNKRVVSMVEFEAKDKIKMGAERRSMVMTEAQKSRPRTTKRATRLSMLWCGTRSGAQSDDYPARSCAGRDLLPA